MYLEQLDRLKTLGLKLMYYFLGFQAAAMLLVVTTNVCLIDASHDYSKAERIYREKQRNEAAIASLESQNGDLHTMLYRERQANEKLRKKKAGYVGHSIGSGSSVVVGSTQRVIDVYNQPQYQDQEPRRCNTQNTDVEEEYYYSMSMYHTWQKMNSIVRSVCLIKL